jgi:hypothetical protein
MWYSLKIPELFLFENQASKNERKEQLPWSKVGVYWRGGPPGLVLTIVTWERVLNVL